MTRERVAVATLRDSNPTALQRLSILLIEDNADHARAIEIMSTRLDEFAFTFVCAESLAGWLDHWEDRQEEPDRSTITENINA